MAHRLIPTGGLLAALLLGTLPSAYAATGAPPVTAPDHAVVRADESTPVDVAANDSDPDGDQVTVCRLGDLPRALRSSSVEQGQLYILPGRGARGTFTITYYACDDSYLTAGTLTVKVRPPRPDLLIEPVGPPPGRIRLVNQFKNVTFHCEWHALHPSRLLGKVTVRPRSTEVITVRVAAFEILCESPHQGVGALFTGAGSVTTRDRPTVG